jgi:hypothetical protein
MRAQGRAAVGKNRDFYSPYEKKKVTAKVDSIEEFDTKHGKRKMAYGQDTQGRKLRQFTS